jgi:NhaA family Na+:H+ antiporter
LNRGVFNYIVDNSLLLLAGAVAGLVWANLGPNSYEWFCDIPILSAGLFFLPGKLPGHEIGLRYLINDVLMAFFFALAGKEVWEALLPGGALRNPRRAAVPVVCAIGGMAGPAALYLCGAALLGKFSEISNGWAIPCATDIAFSYMIARVIFGRHHPAIPFLLLLAITDDALGLIILATCYPLEPVQPLWLLLPLASVILGLGMRRLRVRSFWWYLLGPGVLSWSGMALSGLHPALGLLPVIPTLPHRHTVDAHVHWGGTGRRDALDRFGDWWTRPVEFILCLFGLTNAGVTVTSFGVPGILILVGLLAGKPLGIFFSGWLCKAVRLQLPEGVSLPILLVVGCTAGIGFTVALFVATVAFEAGPVQNSAKMGALASCLAVATAFASARLLGVRRRGEGKQL